MLKLFFDAKEEKYYCDESFECTICRQDIQGYMLLAFFWNKKNEGDKSRIGTYCRNCFNKFKGCGIINEYKLVKLTSIPHHAYPLLIRPPNLKESSEYSSFDAAYIESEDTEDKTIYSHNDCIEGAKIGYEIDDRMKELDTDNPFLDPTIYLNDLKTAKPTINYFEKKRITDGQSNS